MKKLFILTVTALLIVCSFSACKGNARQDGKKNNIIIKEESSVESSPSIDTNTFSDISSTTEFENVFEDEEIYEEVEEEPPLLELPLALEAPPPELATCCFTISAIPIVKILLFLLSMNK